MQVKEQHNMHEQHRARLRKRLLENGRLDEHELLELLLFYAMPRKNTNDLAHLLINQFGSVEAVLKAEPDVLCSVIGVGEATAALLCTLGKVLEKSKENKIEFPQIFSFESIKEPLIRSFRDAREESFIAFFLDSRHKIISKKLFCNNLSDRVDIDLAEFTKQMIAVKPKYVAIVHNHLSGLVVPSEKDDDTTLKIYLLLKLHGVLLIDHLIVSGNDVYSYFYDNRFERIIDGAKKSIID